MTYRTMQRVCTFCDEAPAVSECRRCHASVCAFHTPLSDGHCEHCEHEWRQRAQPRRTIGRMPLIVLLLSWCLVAAVMTNGNYLDAFRWLGSYLLLGLTLAFLGATQWTSLSVARERRRFLRERRTEPRPRVVLSAPKTPPRPPRRTMARRRLASTSHQPSRWQVQKLSR